MSLLLIPKPTCFRKCLSTFFTGICLWHTVQGYGFSPEIVVCWFLNLHALENVSRHTSKGYVSDILYKDMVLSWMSLLLILKPTCFKKCLTTYFTGIYFSKIMPKQKDLGCKLGHKTFSSNRRLRVHIGRSHEALKLN